jgi:hypothetical protein
MQLHVGMQVRARYKAGEFGAQRTKFHPGRIAEMYDDGTCKVLYQDGDIEDHVDRKWIAPPARKRRLANADAPPQACAAISEASTQTSTAETTHLAAASRGGAAPRADNLVPPPHLALEGQAWTPASFYGGFAWEESGDGAAAAPAVNASAGKAGIRPPRPCGTPGCGLPARHAGACEPDRVRGPRRPASASAASSAAASTTSNAGSPASSSAAASTTSNARPSSPSASASRTAVAASSSRPEPRRNDDPEQILHHGFVEAPALLTAAVCAQLDGLDRARAERISNALQLSVEGPELRLVERIVASSQLVRQVTRAPPPPPRLP